MFVYEVVVRKTITTVAEDEKGRAEVFVNECEYDPNRYSNKPEAIGEILDFLKSIKDEFIRKGNKLEVEVDEYRDRIVFKSEIQLDPYQHIVLEAKCTKTFVGEFEGTPKKTFIRV